MASITTLVLGAMIALSYFNFTNIDLSAVKKEYKDTSTWLTDQAAVLRRDALAHIHSTVGGMLGLFVGSRKKTS